MMMISPRSFASTFKLNHRDPPIFRPDSCVSHRMLETDDVFQSVALLSFLFEDETKSAKFLS